MGEFCYQKQRTCEIIKVFLVSVVFLLINILNVSDHFCFQSGLGTLNSELVSISSHLPVFGVESAYALDVPQLKYHVNDYANMMSSDARSKIEDDLKAFEQSDSTQIVILTIPSLEGEVLEEFSIKVAEAWKIGQKGKDNGAILVVAAKERKIRIEVGRGLEGKLTDLASGQIIDLVMKPRFQSGDYDGGFIAAAQALIDVTRGEFKADERQTSAGRKRSAPFPVLFMFGAMALLTLGRISRVLGGTAGAIGFSLIGFLMGFPLIAIVLIGVLGLAMGIFLPLLFGGFGTGGGGFWPGGFGGFGGRDGGGGDFGGFSGGGGDFGGGGASGDW
jgi:uncharacterized protein